MASDGLLNKAKKGTCRICQRVRNTNDQVKTVGEVRHGYATGHIWECIDTEDCDKVAQRKIASNKTKLVVRERIKIALERGRLQEYLVIV
jgi:hypothetical protein